MQASIGTFGVNGFLGVRVAVRLPISIFGGRYRSTSAVAQDELEPSHQAAIEVSRDLVTQARPHFEPHSDRPPFPTPAFTRLGAGRVRRTGWEA